MAKHSARPAFTLIEVTISVALALVLMLGVSQVFRVVGDTVGAGQELASIQRDARAAQAVMASDFNTAVTDGAPFMLLYSQQVFAFRNANDQAGSKTGNSSYADLTGSGSESLLPAALYNYRSHRVDALTFFGRGSFTRQTGADVSSGSYGTSPFVSNMGSMEAMLWYGHLVLPDNTGSFSSSGGNTPGAGSQSTNPNNYFATDWILGRQQMVLRERSSLDNDNTVLSAPQIVDNTYPKGNAQFAYMPTTGVPLSPLSIGSIPYNSQGTTLELNTTLNGPALLQTSRIDLAATSILGYRNILSTYMANNPTARWWTYLFTGSGPNRFQGQPFFIPASSTAPKITPEQMAYQAPIFLRGCTQFTVEYAGDYLNQNATSASATAANQGITDTLYRTDPTTHKTVETGTTDGQIDYVLSGTYPNFTRSIRWYGLPRSTTNTPGTTPGTLVSIKASNGDACPLYDTFRIAAASNMLVNDSSGNTVVPATNATFEVFPNPVSPAVADYGNASTGMQSGAQYVCAWGPNDPKPKMIRITMTVDAPGGRLADGQTYEYIYTLP